MASTRLLLSIFFSGIGGARRGLELAGVHVACHVAVECSAAAHRVSQWAWPASVHFKDVADCKEGIVDAIRSNGCRVTHVLVVFGSPCMDVSSLNAGAVGLSGSRSNLVRLVPPLLEYLRKELPHVLVDFIGENVSYMKRQSDINLPAFNSILGVQSIEICAGPPTGMRRPRL